VPAKISERATPYFCVLLLPVPLFSALPPSFWPDYRGDISEVVAVDRKKEKGREGETVGFIPHG